MHIWVEASINAAVGVSTRLVHAALFYIIYFFFLKILSRCFSSHLNCRHTHTHTVYDYRRIVCAAKLVLSTETAWSKQCQIHFPYTPSHYLPDQTIRCLFFCISMFLFFILRSLLIRSWVANQMRTNEQQQQQQKNDDSTRSTETNCGQNVRFVRGLWFRY